MVSVNQHIDSIQSSLEKQSNLLVKNLRNIFAYTFSFDIDLLNFSAFIDPLRFELSITIFSMDHEANEVFNEGNDATVFAGSVQVLQEIKYHHICESQRDDFFSFYEENEEPIIQLEQKAFTDWFSQCWKKAGGNQLNLPSYFGFHDEYKSFDLKSQQWIDDEEKWS